jgi:hypothetical protein
MRILVGTPTYNGTVTGLYCRSMLSLFGELGPSLTWETTKAVLIVIARNYLASVVLERDFTHLLFVDADVDFAPSVVHRMLAFDQPVVAAAYPHRALNLAALHAASRRYDNPNVAMTAALTFPVELEQPRVTRDDFHRAIVAPTGLMLIKRAVFEAMRDAYPALYCDARETSYAEQGLARVLQCFEPLANDQGVMVGEDLSFCRRWRGLGGEIWLTFDESIGHTGPYTFRAAPNG